jgi:hypothetical protein
VSYRTLTNEWRLVDRAPRCKYSSFPYIELSTMVRMAAPWEPRVSLDIRLEVSR